MFHPYLMTSGARQGAYVQKSDPPLPSLHVRLIQTLLVWMLNNADQYQQPSYPCSVLERRGDLLLLLQIPFHPPSLRQMQSGCCATTSSLPLSSSSLLVFYISPKRKRKEEEGSLITDQSPFLFPPFLTLPPPLQCAVLSYSWLGGSEMIVDV